MNSLWLVLSMLSTSRNLKTIILIRHGVTEMNDYLHSNPWGSKDFVDPNIRDTFLTKEGENLTLCLSYLRCFVTIR
jgi:hypothetical protein